MITQSGSARVGRLFGAAVFALAAGVSSLPAAYAATSTPAGNDGVGHFFDCLGKIGNSAEHAATCGPSQVPPNNNTLAPQIDNGTECPILGTRAPLAGTVRLASLGDGREFLYDAQPTARPLPGTLLATPDPCHYHCASLSPGDLGAFGFPSLATFGVVDDRSPAPPKALLACI